MSHRGREAVVIGGGIVGASCAYFLLDEGFHVTLVEKETLAYGASGRNPGYVWIHLRRPGTGLRLALAGAALYPRLAEEIGIDFEYRRNGGMIFFFSEAERQVLSELVARRRQDGVPMDLVDGPAARDLCPVLSEQVLGATFCPLDAQISTPKFVRALGETVRRRGGRVIEKTEARRIVLSGGRVSGVETDAGSLTADLVVVAMGVWSPPFLQEIGISLPVFPMRLQVVATGPMPPLFDRLLYGPLALKQYDLVRELPSYREELFRSPLEERLEHIEFLELLCQRRDGTVLMGCPMDFAGYIQEPTVEGVGITCQVIADHIPWLRNAPVAQAWAGLLPFTTDNLPIIGPVPGYDGLLVAAGHVFGNAAGPITGKVIAEMAAGKPPSIDVADCRLDRPFPPSAHDTTKW